MLMKQKIIILLSVLFCSIMMFAHTNCLAGSGPNLHEGLWEVTSKMEMMGMNMPAMTHRQCITRDNAVPDRSQQDQECKLVNTTVKDDTVKWHMVCDSPEGKSTMKGEITYHGDTFKGFLKIDMQGMAMIQHMSGRRVGECEN